MMLKRLFKKWISPKVEGGQWPEKGADESFQRHVIPRSEHSLSRKEISENALKVLYRLKKHGFCGYLVGGGVRDILLGFHPKDFDIVTNASPEEIKGIFSNCRLIGRRFRLAHIFYGRDIIEVATFRGKATVSANTVTSDQGMILRDNVYGTIEEDVWRRDFTLNALYYNIKDFSLVDYCGGLEDLKNKTLKMIGEPSQRFVEDPVRILRAVRLSSKLDLNLDSALPPAMIEHGPLLSHVPTARLYEETLKLFHSGAAVKVYHSLKALKLFYHLFPMLEHVSNPKLADEFILTVLQSTDARFKIGKPVNPAFIFAAFLWYPLRDAMEKLKTKQHSAGVFPDMKQMAEFVLSEQRKTVTLPRRHTLVVKEIWLMQIRLERKQARRVEKLLFEQRFRASYDFLLFRGMVGEQVDCAKWWESFVESDENTQRQMAKALENHKSKSKAKKKRKPKSSDEEAVE